MMSANDWTDASGRGIRSKGAHFRGWLKHQHETTKETPSQKTTTPSEPKMDNGDRERFERFSKLDDQYDELFPEERLDGMSWVNRLPEEYQDDAEDVLLWDHQLYAYSVMYCGMPEDTSIEAYSMEHLMYCF